MDCTRKIVTSTRELVDKLKAIDEVYIVGDPKVSVVAFASDKFNIFALMDVMKEKGWHLNALQFPACIHLCLTMLHTQPGVVDKFIGDIRQGIKAILAEPEKHKGGSAAMYGMAQSIPDRGLIDLMTTIYLDSLYATTTKK